MANLTKIHSDIDFMFTRKPVTNDIALSYDTQAINRSIRNLVSTKHYERLWNPALGSNIDTTLFEPFSSATSESIKVEILEIISKFEPRATVKNIVINPKPDLNSYSATISYYVENATLPTTITLLLERNR